jgi:hypothetical protein
MFKAWPSLRPNAFNASTRPSVRVDRFEAPTCRLRAGRPVLYADQATGCGQTGSNRTRSSAAKAATRG